MKRFLLIALLVLAGGLRAEAFEKITEYKFVCNDGENFILTDIVNRLIAEGWQPVGPASRGGYADRYLKVVDKEAKFTYCQTLVKKKMVSFGCPTPVPSPTSVPTPLTELLAVSFKDNFFVDAKTLKKGPHEKIEVLIHVAVKGDTLGGLAKKFYKDANLWPIIFYDNLGNYIPENLHGYIWGNRLLAPDLVPEGLRVRIRKSPIDVENKEQVKEWLEEFKKP